MFIAIMVIVLVASFAAMLDVSFIGFFGKDLQDLFQEKLQIKAEEKYKKQAQNGDLSFCELSENGKLTISSIPGQIELL